MTYLLDTNVISELFRSNSNPQVVNWIKSISNDELYLSVLSLGEVRKGAEKLVPSNKKQKIIHWLEHDLIQWFDNRLLPIDQNVADKWGFLSANAKYSIPVIDTLLAATALVHNLKFVTRNVKDFASFPLEVFNPWE